VDSDLDLDSDPVDSDSSPVDLDSDPKDSDSKPEDSDSDPVDSDSDSDSRYTRYAITYWSTNNEKLGYTYTQDLWFVILQLHYVCAVQFLQFKQRLKRFQKSVRKPAD